MNKRAAIVVTCIAAVCVVALAIAASLTWRWYDRTLAVKAPHYPTPTSVSWARQNWTPAQRSWFHSADQGALTFGMPYEWFTALKQPEPFASGRLSDPAYLDRFGFIGDPGQTGPDRLAVGFAHGGPVTLKDGSPWRNPQTGAAFTGVGFTCAACHTGRLTYQGHEVLIDGSPALTSVGLLRKAVGEAVIFTLRLPWRFDDFQRRVLGPNASPAAKAALKDQLKTYLAAGQRELAWSKATGVKNVEEGFARLDALDRIGNQIFALDMDQQANYAPLLAPVRFPQIWESSWFTWVQYNGAIAQPMVRNAGEVLGVAANVTAAGPAIFASSIRFDVLDQLEHQLAGPAPTAATGFTGLKPPRWADTPLPPIDANLARQGAPLYARLCQGCHLAPTSSPEFWSSPRWTAPNAAGERYLDPVMVDLDRIGTDPAQALGLANRKVQVPTALGIKETGFGPALGQMVEKTVYHWYDAQTPPTPAADRDRMNGFRANRLQAVMQYKARPLDGVWAMPPYLHNGSVPNLYDLLSPVADRPTTFYLGAREYDPKKVGYQSGPLKNGFLFDTRTGGNSNRGHEFSDTPGPGVIGPKLSDADRMAIIEYLKTL